MDITDTELLALAPCYDVSGDWSEYLASVGFANVKSISPKDLARHREWFANATARVRVWQRQRVVVCDVGRTRYEAKTGSVAEAWGVLFREYRRPSQARFQWLRQAVAIELCATWLVNAFAVAMGELGRRLAWEQLDGTTKRFTLLELW